MLKQFWMLLFAALLPLSACGPLYTTKYTMVPPPTSEGRMCVQQCSQARAYCRQGCKIEKMECSQDARDRAMRDYRAYVRRQQAENKPVRKSPSDFEYSYCSTSSCDQQCEDDHRGCYTDCGGQVIARQVCTAFCDQAPRQPQFTAAPVVKPLPGTNAYTPLCRPGERVEVLSDGEWYDAVVTAPLQADGRCPIHYDGYDEDEDEAVGPKRLRPAAQN